MSDQDFDKLAARVRHHILTTTSTAGSGHPTSSMSAADIMTVLYFKHLRAIPDQPDNPNNDRVIFSKGHAAPLLYALYAVAGLVSVDEIHTLRKHGSPFQGHPTPALPFVEAATGSLGQGLSVGVGQAINAKYLDKVPHRTFVLLGDGEMAEGSVWEAIQLAAHYKLDNLIGVIDVNRMGQSQETMYGADAQAYADRVASFGWHVETIDGHDTAACDQALEKALAVTGKPAMIVAKTEKGKGVSFLSGKEGWHGKALPDDKLQEALAELGEVDLELKGEIQAPEKVKATRPAAAGEPAAPDYKLGDTIATRKAYGLALAKFVPHYPDIVAIDGDTKNSTFAEDVAKTHPDHYFEMFIAEQNMAGVAVGLSRRGKIPFASSFAAFWSRAFDQFRMGAVSEANIKVCGSHVGVSIGQDGPSQMGLEDIAMFRAIPGSTVLYPSDGVSAERLVAASIDQKGIVYIRTSRPATPVIYTAAEQFPIGGSKVVRHSDQDAITLVGAGVTLHECLKAQEALAQDGINARVIDCYSVKPIDAATLKTAAEETKALFVVEDHWFDGGLGDAVLNVFAAEANTSPIIKVAVTELAGSATPEELMDDAGISAKKIVERVKEFIA